MKCPNCGSPIKRGDLFCGHCGAKRKKKAKKGLLVLIGFLVMIFVLAVIAYKLLMPGTAQEGTVEDGFVCLSEGFTDIKIVDETSALAAVEDVAKTLGIGNAEKELADCAQRNALGSNFYNFSQQYEGIPVYGRNIIVGAGENGASETLSGNYLKIDGVSVQPDISAETAYSIVGETYSWAESIFNEGLTIYSLGGVAPELAWQFYVDGTEDALRCFVSAKDGHLIADQALVYYETAIGYGTDAYGNSNVRFNVNYENGYYYMEDWERGIHVYDAKGGTVTHELVFIDNQNNIYHIVNPKNEQGFWATKDGKRIRLEAERNGEDSPYKVFDAETNQLLGEGAWYGVYFDIKNPFIAIEQPKNKSQIWDNVTAVSTMEFVAKANDFYGEVLGRNGFGDRGGDVYAVFGDMMDFHSSNSCSTSPGDRHTIAKYMTVLQFGKDASLSYDLVGHEYTHSVERSISGMIYENQSGAIMEALSDIFGEMFEVWATSAVQDEAGIWHGTLDGSCDWALSGSRNFADPALSMLDLKSNPCPRSMYDQYYCSGPDDRGGVHNNSTVVSHAAYLMSMGIDGSDSYEKLNNYDLVQLFYKAMFSLPSDCTFFQFRTVVENTAQLMGFSQAKQNCISAAFENVGITSQLVIYNIQCSSEMSVFGAGLTPYDDFSYEIMPALLPKSGNAHDFWPKGTSPRISGSGVNQPIKLELEKGTYILVLSDNADSSRKYTCALKVGLDKDNGRYSFSLYPPFGAKTYLPDLSPAPSSPDYSLYVPVIEKAIAERPYSGDDYGILYDLDKDGVEELFMLHTYSGGAIPEMGYSIYDINDGALVTRAEKQTLIVMAGGGGCMAGISETDGGTYFYAYSLQIGDVYADSVITVYDQSFSVYKTFEANMETEGTHITQDSYITSFSIDGSPCAVAEYKLLLSTLLPFDTACFQLENAGQQNGRFYNGQWYGETLTALLNRLKASSEPDIDETINGEDAYREVLDMFYRNIQNGWTELDHENWDNPCDPDSVSDYYLINPAASISPKSPRSLSEVGYCIRDIGGDGVPELLVSLLYFSENDPGTICDLYTLSDGCPVHLASSDKVIRYYLAENGITCTEGTSITWVNGNYRIDSEAGDLKVNQAVISEGTFSTPTTWYYTETDSFDRCTFVLNYDEMINISEEEAHRIIDSFPQRKAYPLTTFDQYRPGVQRVEKDKADENGSLNIPVLEGTWANEFSEDIFSLFYLTEFSSDGTVVQHGYRNIDKGSFQITGANTAVASFDDNYYDTPGFGLQKIADYSYTVTYTYDKSSDTLFADYSTEFENAVHSNANDGTLSRWNDGNDTVAGKDAAPKKLSESDAQRIAEWYWQDSLETPSEIWADIAAKVHGTKTYQGNEFYYCTLTGRVDGHRTTLDYLYIDAETGDCYFGIDHPEELIYEGSVLIQPLLYDNINFINPIPMALSTEQRYRINIFLSNFSEQWFHEEYDYALRDWVGSSQEFTSQSADPMELMRFAWLYAKINMQAAEWLDLNDGIYYGVSIDTIDAISYRFFGRSIADDISEAQERGDILVLNGLVCEPAATGETYNRMTLVEDVCDLSDGTLKVSFKIYSVEIGDGSIVYAGGTIHDKSVYYLTQEEADRDSRFMLEGTGEAILRTYITDSGTESYQLVSYQVA